jgi:hypothetical protein
LHKPSGVAEEGATELDPASANRWAVRICAFTGAWGILTGFAVFVLVRTQDFSEPVYFVLGLGVAAGASFVVEMLRESMRGEILPRPTRRIGHIIVTILSLLVFELFVLAAHNAVDMSSHAGEVAKLRVALLGPSLDTPSALRDLIVLAVLWLVPGAAIGWFLGRFVVNQDPEQSIRERALRGGGVGVLVALLAAPIVVFAYVLFWRLVLTLALAITQPALLAADYDSVMLGLARHGAGAGYPMVVIVGGTFAIMGLLKLWLWSIAGKAIDLAVFVLVVLSGVRFNEWRPFGIVVAGVIVGVVAPLFVDFGDVAKLALLAAVVWVVPGLVLGLAAPLLDRPSDRANWWSAIATALGIVVAVITALRWQYLGLQQNAIFVLLAVAFFAVALLFTRFRNIQEFWPALALCLSAIATGLTLLLVTHTVSFHSVLAEVNAVNALSASIAPTDEAKKFADDLSELEGWWNRPYHAVPTNIPAPISYEVKLGDIESSPAATRKKTIEDQRPDLIKLRARAMNGLIGLAANKRLYIEQSLRARPRAQWRDPLLDSLDGVASLSGEALQLMLAHEKVLVYDRQDSVRDDDIESKHWETYLIQLFVIGGRVVTNDKVLADLDAIEGRAGDETRLAAQEDTFEHDIAPEQLEVSLAGSFAFWVTVGLLSTWAIRRRALLPVEKPAS